MHVQAYTYTIPFTEPVQLANGPVGEKSGFLIRLEENNRTGWGDVSPLIGYSPETMQAISDRLPAALDEITSGQYQSVRDRSLPSLSCGIQFALEGLQQENPPMIPPAATACLLNAKADVDLRACALDAVSGGFRCLKVKVGRNNIESDIRQVQELLSVLPDHVTVRLDANRAWSLEDAIRFSAAVCASNIAFIEEPLRDVNAYEAYDQRTKLSFAFDESLWSRPVPDVSRFRHLSALVLKPSLLGGPQACAVWAKAAESSGVACVLSAMYESGVGMRSLMGMASLPPYSRQLPGFDTYGMLACDIVNPALRMESGIFQPGDGWSVNLKNVEKVYDSD